MEENIARAEETLQLKRGALADPELLGDAGRLRAACTEMDAAQQTVEKLYARWAELEKKNH